MQTTLSPLLHVWNIKVSVYHAGASGYISGRSSKTYSRCLAQYGHISGALTCYGLVRRIREPSYRLYMWLTGLFFDAALMLREVPYFQC